MTNKKKRKGPDYQLANTGSWIVSSPRAERAIAELARKHRRKEAWARKVQKNS